MSTVTIGVNAVEAVGAVLTCSGIDDVGECVSGAGGAPTSST